MQKFALLMNTDGPVARIRLDGDGARDVCFGLRSKGPDAGANDQNYYQQTQKQGGTTNNQNGGKFRVSSPNSDHCASLLEHHLSMHSFSCSLSRMLAQP